MTETEQILLAQEDPQARENLLTEHEGFICRCASKAAGRFVDCHDDAYSEALIAFNDAVTAYQPDKGSFYALAATAISNRVTDLLRRESRSGNCIPFSSLGTQGESAGERFFDIEDPTPMVTDTTLEIDALRQELEPFGISFFDLPKASPKFGRTKAACREVIHWLVSRPDLVRSIREKKYLPVRQITDALHTGGKILERNRTYIIAGVLICTAAFGHHLYFTPTSYVYLDINPSIRLDLNRFERIIDVVPLNDDAENLLSSATISRKNARECMNDIVAACQEQNYLNEQNTDIEVSVRTDDAKLESAVETASAAIGETELAVSVFQMDEEENNSAMGYHISARRLRAVRAYTEQFGGTLDENLEALKGVTSDEIYEIIREYRRTVQAAEKPGAQPQTENSAPPETSLSPDTPQPKPQNPSDRREEPQAQHPDSPASNSQPAPGHQLTAKRLDAIRAYAEQFGGTLEENAALLQGISSSEIYRMIEEVQAETPEQTIESDAP